MHLTATTGDRTGNVCVEETGTQLLHKHPREPAWIALQARNMNSIVPSIVGSRSRVEALRGATLDSAATVRFP